MSEEWETELPGADDFAEAVRTTQPAWLAEHILNPGYQATVGALAFAVQKIIKDAVVAVENCPEKPVGADSWFRALMRSCFGKPVWEMRPQLGTVRLIVVTPNDVSEDTAKLVALETDKIRPAGVVIETEFHVAVGGG